MIRLDQNAFEETTRRVIDGLPSRFAELLDNVFVVIEDLPSIEDLASVGMAPHEAHDLLGLYQGVPLGDRGVEYAELPDRVVLYRLPILASCATRADVEHEIRDTLIHELGHHFGLDDDEMPF